MDSEQIPTGSSTFALKRIAEDYLQRAKDQAFKHGQPNVWLIGGYVPYDAVFVQNGIFQFRKCQNGIDVLTSVPADKILSFSVKLDPVDPAQA